MPENDNLQGGTTIENGSDVCEEKKYVTAHPFAYNIIEDNGNISLMTQREASYREPAEEVYNNKKLDDGKLFWESFRDNIEPPTPQIKELDGYKSEEEVSQDGEDDGGQG